MAARVPDHGKLGPWRFLIFQGETRQAFGTHLARVLSGQEPTADQSRLDFERDRFRRAPTVVAVISKMIAHPKIPKWEQELSSGAVCQNMLIGASALGYAAQWLTEWYAYDQEINDVLGLSEGERVAGFLYLGSTSAEPLERRRPSLEERVSYWQPSET
jgi:nitroreductase